MQNAPTALDAALSRFEFYRDRYRTAVKVCLVQALAIVVLVGLLCALALRQQEPRYFATTQSGQLFELTPLDRPSMPEAEALAWAARAVARAYTFDFANYRDQLTAAKPAFTEGGWANFYQALDAAGTIEAVVRRRLVATAMPGASPVLLAQGRLDNGRYAYRIQFPLVVTYQSSNESRTQRLRITAVLARVPVTQTPEGLGIEQLVAEPDAGQ